MSERFRFPITAVAADIDGLGHVSNLVYLRWVLEAATAHSIARGWGLAEYQALGNIWVVRRHELDYLGPVTAGQTLVAETWVESWRAASCVRRTELVRTENGAGQIHTDLRDGQVVARAATTWAFMSIASGRPQRIPEHLRAPFI